MNCSRMSKRLNKTNKLTDFYPKPSKQGVKKLFRLSKYSNIKTISELHVYLTRNCKQTNWIWQGIQESKRKEKRATWSSTVASFICEHMSIFFNKHLERSWWRSDQNTLFRECRAHLKQCISFLAPRSDGCSLCGLSFGS